MKVYVIRTGNMYDDNGALLFVAYSGGNKGAVPLAVNNPDYCNIHNVGPIPPGLYTIGIPHDDRVTGPHTMSLTPDATNEMYGRSEFKCHGASLEDAKTGKQVSSEGCIVKSPANVRCQIYTVGEKRLRVVAEESERNEIHNLLSGAPKEPHGNDEVRP